MFSFKKFSLISFAALLIGKSVAVTLPACTKFKADFASSDCEASSDPTLTYCLHEGKIYGVTAINKFACNTTPLSAGVYVLKVNTEDVYEMTTEAPDNWSTVCTDYFTKPVDTYVAVTDCTTGPTEWAADTYYSKEEDIEVVTSVALSGGAVDPIASNLTKVTMYICNTSKCKQTVGYVKVQWNDGDDQTKYYAIKKDGAVDADSGTATCSSSRVGLQSATHGVCIKDTTSIEYNSSDSYLLEGTLAAGSIFTLPTSGIETGIVIAVNGNNIIYHNILKPVLQYDTPILKSVVGSDGIQLVKNNVAVTSKSIETCTNERRCKLYKCTEAQGDCTTFDLTGYTLFGNALIYCEINQCYYIPTPYGYYVNDGFDKDTKGLIECNGSACVSKTAEISYYYLKGNGKLIVCNSNQSSCVNQDQPASGYYINKGIDVTNKPMIRCVDGSCVAVAKASITDIECDDNNVGELILYNSKINYVCLGATEGYKEVKTLANSNFYLIEIPNGKMNGFTKRNAPNKFIIKMNSVSATIVTSNKDLQKNNRNPLVETTDAFDLDITGNIVRHYISSDGTYKGKRESCTATWVQSSLSVSNCNLGNYLINTSRNKVVAPIDSTLSECDSNTCVLWVYTIKEGNVVIEAAQRFSGYAVLAMNNRIVKCTTGNCKINSDAQNGHVINALGTDSNDWLIIMDNSYDYGYYTNASPGFYISGQGDKASKPLIECDNEGCKPIAYKKGNYIDGTNNSNLITCEDNSCDYKDINGKYSNSIIEKDGEIYNINYYYYINAADDETLIQCSWNEYKDETICNEIPNPDNGYYLNSSEISDAKPVIQCTNNVCTEVPVNDNYYFLSCNPAIRLIRCNLENGCEYENSSYGYYLNAGSDKTTNPILQCNGSSCGIADISKAKEKCSESGIAGLLIDNQGKFNKKMCIAIDDVDASAINIADTGETKYYAIKITRGKSSVFTGNSAVTSDTDVLIKLENNNAVELVISDRNKFDVNIETHELRNFQFNIDGGVKRYRIENNKITNVINSCTATYSGEDGSKELVIDSSCKTEFYLISNDKNTLIKNSDLSSHCKNESGKKCKLLKCNSNNGSTKCVMNTTLNGSIYIYHHGKVFTCTSGECYIETTIGYYLNAEDENNISIIYVRDNFDSYIISPVDIGYYVNGSDSSSVIHCKKNDNSIKCEVKTSKSSCTAVGDILKADDNKLYLCQTAAATKTDAIEISNTDVRSAKYAHLKVAAEGKNPFTNEDESEVKYLFYKQEKGCLILNTSILQTINVKSDGTVGSIDDNCLYAKYRYTIENGVISYIKECVKRCRPRIGTQSIGCENTDGYYLDNDNILWKCASSNSCSRLHYNNHIIGYVRNAGNTDNTPFIRCTKSRCEEYTAEIKEDCRSVSAIGNIIRKIDEDLVDHYTFCLTKNEHGGIALDPSNSQLKSYFINMSNSNVFGDAKANRYAIIDVFGGEVFLNQDYDVPYRFVNKLTDLPEIIDTCPVEGKENLDEYDLDTSDSNYYYQKL